LISSHWSRSRATTRSSRQSGPSWRHHGRTGSRRRRRWPITASADRHKRWSTDRAGTSCPQPIPPRPGAGLARKARWLGVGSAAQSLTLVIALALAIVVVVLWLDRASISSQEYLEVPLLMLLVPLFSPQGRDYVLLLATPAAMLIVDRWRELERGWKVFAGTSLVLMCLTIFDLMGRAPYGRFMALSIVSVAAIGVAIVLGVCGRMRLW
jgi:hypothetical protein